MKVLVTYYTQSGMTKIIAEAIYSSIKDSTDVMIKAIKNVKISELVNYDVVFIGSPCHHADIVKEVKKFISKIPKKAKFKLAGFLTHACYPREKGGKYESLFDRWVGKSQQSFETIAEERELNYRGFFRCMAAAVKPIEKFIHRKIVTDKEEFEEYVIELKKHPDEKDKENAKIFAQQIIKS